MKATLAQSPSDRGRPIPTTDKPCQYPGCGVIFNGIGAAKYCEEHRKPEFRKILNALRTEEKKKTLNLNMPNNSNMIIAHTNHVATNITRTCACGKDYMITLFPNINVYPKYCETHTNPYQRDMLLKSLGLNEAELKQDHHDNTKIENEVLIIDKTEILNLESEFGADVFNDSVQNFI